MLEISPKQTPHYTLKASQSNPDNFKFSSSSHSLKRLKHINMHSTTIFTSLVALASIATATPTPRDIYYGVSVNVITSAGLDPNKVSEPAPVEINKLTQINCGEGLGCSVSELILDPGVHANVDINAVECRGFKDAAGVQPGSLPFNVTIPAEISTNLGTISSILCYIVETE